MRIFLAFLVLTVLLTATIVYTYYIRRGIIMYEGFTEENISNIEQSVRKAVPARPQSWSLEAGDSRWGNGQCATSGQDRGRDGSG